MEHMMKTKALHFICFMLIVKISKYDKLHLLLNTVCSMNVLGLTQYFGIRKPFSIG